MSFLYTRITGTDDFADQFNNAGRGEQFSRFALDAIFAYYTNYAEECEEMFEVDPIAICCDWTEYNSMQDARKENLLDGDDPDLDEITVVIELDNGHVVIQNF